MSRKTLLVLAASMYQLPVIQEARRLGYRIVTADNVLSNPGHALADACYNVDTRDREAMLTVAQHEKVAGVIAACTDVALPTAAYIGEQLGLCAPPLSAAEIVCDKAAFRQWLMAKGLPCPETITIERGALLDAMIFDGSPWVLKPTRASGSKGIFLVQTPEDFQARLSETLQFSQSAVLERFVEGRQLTCEGVLCGGKIAAAWILDRQIAIPPYLATAGHRLPARLSDTDRKRVLQVLEAVWAELNVTEGPFDSDIILHDSTVQLLEISPRIGGNSIAVLLRCAAGFDLINYAVRLAVGDALERVFPSEIIPSAILILGVPQKGLFRYDADEAERLSQEEWVHHLQIDRKAGDPVEAFKDGLCRIGEALIVANTRDELDARVDEFLNRLKMGSE